MLFIDYSSSFNIIILNILTSKLQDVGLSITTCTWIKDFLTNHSQRVRIGPYISSTIKLTIGATQTCVLTPLLYSLYTYKPTCPTPNSNSLTTQLLSVSSLERMIWHIGRDSETARVVLSKQPDTEHHKDQGVNTGLQKEMWHRSWPSLLKWGMCGKGTDFQVPWGPNIQGLVLVSQNHSKRAQQRLHFLRVLRRHNPKKKLLMAFY